MISFLRTENLYSGDGDSKKSDETIVKSVSEAAEESFEAFGTVVEKVWKATTESVSENYNTISETVGDGYDSVANGLESGWDWIVEKLDFSDDSSEITNSVQAVAKEVENTVNNDITP